MSRRHRFASVAAVAAVVAIAVLLSASVAPVVAQPLPAARLVATRVDSLARAWIATRGSPGLSIAVVRDRDTLVFAAWGMAELENDVAATPRTVYEIGSITKQFTSAAVMQEVERGRVRLDDSIATYLPTLPAAWRPVTVRQLLNHTSGIPSYTNLGVRWVRRWGEEMPPDTLVALTAGEPMSFPPGTQWQYNNTGYVILGMLIEKVTSRSWADDVQARFAGPLGLPDTRWCDVKPIIARRARGYEPDGRSFRNAAFLAMTQPFSAGALCSTVGDLSKWNALLHGGRVVSATSYAAMTTPAGAAATGRMRYGFGLAADTLGGRTMIQHGGGINGFLSENAWFPDSRTSVTVFTNSGSGSPGKLMRQVARAALGIPLVQPPARIALSAAERAAYVGAYDLALPTGPRPFTITEQDGALFGKLDAPGQGTFELVPYGKHTFGAEADDTMRLIFTVDGGRASGFALQQRGTSMPATRRP